MKNVMIRVAMTSDRSCYSDKMTPLPTGNCSYKIVICRKRGAFDYAISPQSTSF